MGKELLSALKTAFKADDVDWDDWHWQLASRITDVKALESLPGCLRPEPGDVEAGLLYPMLATPFYLSLAESLSAGDPVMRQCLPCHMELDGAGDDPFCEMEASPVPRLVHRYHDRALFLACGSCAVHCRHCMRKRIWGSQMGAPGDDELGLCVDYLGRHPEIREVLVSGGDPLTLEDEDIGRIVSAFASVPGIEMLRIGSRTLAAMPQRYTERLCRILGNAGCTVWLASHFNHPQELSPEAGEAVLRLMRHGVPVVNQTVLLKGVNDDAGILGRLFTGLLRMRIKPYYLFHGDPVGGTTCFRTGIEAGRRIMGELRGKISGLALPAFAFDLPEGGGKVRLEPDLFAGYAEDGAPMFLKHDGMPVEYR